MVKFTLYSIANVYILLNIFPFFFVSEKKERQKKYKEEKEEKNRNSFDFIFKLMDSKNLHETSESEKCSQQKCTNIEIMIDSLFDKNDLNSCSRFSSSKSASSNRHKLKKIAPKKRKRSPSPSPDRSNEKAKAKKRTIVKHSQNAASPSMDFKTNPEDESLPVLSSEMKEQISVALRPGQPNQILSEDFKLQITRRDIATLGGLNWIMMR